MRSMLKDGRLLELIAGRIEIDQPGLSISHGPSISILTFPLWLKHSVFVLGCLRDRLLDIPVFNDFAIFPMAILNFLEFFSS